MDSVWDFPLEIQINDINVSETTEGGSSFISAALSADENVFFVDRSDEETLDIDNGLWEVRHNGYRVDSSSLSVDQYTQFDHDYGQYFGRRYRHIRVFHSIRRCKLYYLY